MTISTFWASKDLIMGTLQDLKGNKYNDFAETELTQRCQVKADQLDDQIIIQGVWKGLFCITKCLGS